MESFTFKSAIRGYHVYKDIWTPSVDDKRSVEREFKNQFDLFAVKIILDGETVGHLPREFSKIAWYFYCSWMSHYRGRQRSKTPK